MTNYFQNKMGSRGDRRTADSISGQPSLHKVPSKSITKTSKRKLRPRTGGRRSAEKSAKPSRSDTSSTRCLVKRTGIHDKHFFPSPEHSVQNQNTTNRLSNEDTAESNEKENVEPDESGYKAASDLDEEEEAKQKPLTRQCGEIIIRVEPPCHSNGCPKLVGRRVMQKDGHWCSLWGQRRDELENLGHIGGGGGGHCFKYLRNANGTYHVCKVEDRHSKDELIITTELMVVAGILPKYHRIMEFWDAVITVDYNQLYSPLYAGGDVHDLILQKRIHPDNDLYLWHFFLQLCEAVAFIQKGYSMVEDRQVDSKQTDPRRWLSIYHLDIKPANIFIRNIIDEKDGKDGNEMKLPDLVLGDFGLASNIPGREFGGTEGWRPPQRIVTGKSDVYGIGAIMKCMMRVDMEVEKDSSQYWDSPSPTMSIKFRKRGPPTREEQWRRYLKRSPKIREANSKALNVLVAACLAPLDEDRIGIMELLGEVDRGKRACAAKMARDTGDSNDRPGHDVAGDSKAAPRRKIFREKK